MSSSITTWLESIERRIVVSAVGRSGGSKKVWEETVYPDPGSLESATFSSSGGRVDLGGLRLKANAECELERVGGSVLPASESHNLASVRAELEAISEAFERDDDCCNSRCGPEVPFPPLARHMKRVLRLVRRGSLLEAVAILKRFHGPHMGYCDSETLECYGDTGAVEISDHKGGERMLDLLDASWARLGRSFPESHRDRAAAERAWWSVMNHWLSVGFVEDNEDLEDPPLAERAKAWMGRFERLEGAASGTALGVFEAPSAELALLRRLHERNESALFMGRLLHQSQRARALERHERWIAALEERFLPWVHRTARKMAKTDRCAAAAFAGVEVLHSVFDSDPTDIKLSPAWAAFANDAMYWFEPCKETLSLTHDSARRWLAHLVETHPERAAAHLNLADATVLEARRSSRTLDADERVSVAARYQEYAALRTKRGLSIPKRARPYTGSRGLARVRRSIEAALPAPATPITWPPQVPDIAALREAARLLGELHASAERLGEPTVKLDALHTMLLQRLAADARWRAESGWAEWSASHWEVFRELRARSPAHVRAATEEAAKGDKMASPPEESSCASIVFTLLDVPERAF